MIFYRDVHTGRRVSEREALRELRSAVPKREIRVDEVLTSRERRQLPHAAPDGPAPATVPADRAKPRGQEQLSFPPALLSPRAAEPPRGPEAPAANPLDGALAEVSAEAAGGDDDDADTGAQTGDEYEADSSGGVLPGREDELEDLNYEEDLNGEEVDIEPDDPTGGP